MTANRRDSSVDVEESESLPTSLPALSDSCRCRNRHSTSALFLSHLWKMFVARRKRNASQVKRFASSPWLTWARATGRSQGYDRPNRPLLTFGMQHQAIVFPVVFLNFHCFPLSPNFDHHYASNAKARNLVPFRSNCIAAHTARCFR